MCMFLSVRFHAVMGIRLELTYIDTIQMTLGEMINDQTRVIGNMINDQTEVLLAAASAILDNNNAQTITLTNEIRHSTRQITLEMTQQMLDDMQG